MVPFETGFAAALRDPELPVPAGIVAHTHAAPARRFAVYRNNVAIGLIGAIETRFPVVRQLVGDDFFRALARTFVAECPPRSPVLMFYGDDFPDFIAGFAPAAELDYLPDVARLEAARTHAYHAADAEPLGAAEFARLDPDRLGEAIVRLHPSVRVIRSAHPIVTIWAMHAGEAQLGPIAEWQGEDALTARPHLDVETRRLPAGGAEFLRALGTGRPLAEAVESARADDPSFDLTANLAGLIGSGLVAGIRLPEPSENPAP
jgi:hypothetical protein